MSGSAGVRWPPLTVALGDSASPVRHFVDHLIVNKNALRECQRAYRDEAGELVVDSRGANAGTVGTAFDLMLRFLVDPAPNMFLAVAASTKVGPKAPGAVAELIARAGGSIQVPDADDPSVTPPLLTPRTTWGFNFEEIARTCWALALLIEVYRMGGVAPGSPLAALTSRDVSPAGLLSLATPECVAELGALAQLALTRLIPSLSERPTPWYVGPTFIASLMMNADADLIAGGLLLEFKARLGDKRGDGSRQARLDVDTVRQLLGYLLHDVDDRYMIRDVGVYEARYGHLGSWPVQQLLFEIAGRAVDLTAARTAYAETLRTGRLVLP